MIIGETEVILEHQELYNEDYDELFGFLRKKTPQEKQQRKEERHRRKLDTIQRRNERRQARTSDPNSRVRRQELFQDISDSISGAVSSISRSSTNTDNNGIPLTSYTSQQQPTDYGIGLDGFGNPLTPKKKDNTALYLIGGIGGVFALGLLAMLWNQQTKAAK